MQNHLSQSSVPKKYCCLINNRTKVFCINFIMFPILGNAQLNFEAKIVDSH